MPAFVKGKQGEKVWSEAKASVHQSHPDLSEDDEQFWKIVTTIYKKRRPQDIKKKPARWMQRSTVRWIVCHRVPVLRCWERHLLRLARLVCTVAIRMQHI